MKVMLGDYYEYLERKAQEKRDAEHEEFIKRLELLNENEEKRKEKLHHIIASLNESNEDNEGIKECKDELDEAYLDFARRI